VSVARTLDCQSGTASDSRQSFQDLTDQVMQILISKLLYQETDFDFEQLFPRPYGLGNANIDQ